MTPSRRTTLLATGALALLLVAQVAVSGLWMRQNGFLARPPTTEPAYYRLRSLELLQPLQEEGAAAFVRAAYARSEFRTFLLPVATSLVAARSTDGVRPFDMWATMALFAALFTIGVYRLAGNFGPPRFALLVAAVTLCAPVVVVYQRPFYPQLPMKALTVLALDLLVRSRGFARRGASLGFGATAALATMAKVIAPLYLAGSVLAALWFGMRDPARRRAALGNVVLAGIAAALLLLPWLLPHVSRLLDYTGGATDHTAVLRRMDERWTAERWLYYPRHLVNDGFGFFLAVLLAAAAVVRVVRRPRAPAPARREAALVLGAGVLLCYPVLTYGQTAGQSQYVLVWIPLGVLFLVHTAWHVLAGAARRVALGLIGVAAVASLVLALRPPSADRTLLTVGPFEVIARVDHFLSDIPRQWEVVESAAPEEWPVRAFTRAMLAHAPDRVPVIGTLHPFLCGPNLEHEARLAGRDVDERVMPWDDPARLFATIGRLDFLVLDSRLRDPADSVRWLAKLGLQATPLVERTVTPTSQVVLVALTRPWERPAQVLPAVLDEPGVRRHDVRFDGGWRLVGSQQVRALALGPVVHLNTFWAAGEGASPVAVAAGWTPPGVTRPLAAGAPGQLQVVAHELPLPPDGATLVPSIALRSPDAARDPAVRASDLEVREGTWVLLPHGTTR